LASVVEICNLALAHLGDDASIASIDPPEGSAQAEHCARFYPIARDSLLQMHNWNFASRRALLASVTMPYSMWKYAYAVPGDMMVAVSVLPHDAENDYSAKFTPSDNPDFLHNYAPLVAAGRYVPQTYSIETDTNGNKVLYTDQENALQGRSRCIRKQAADADDGGISAASPHERRQPTQHQARTHYRVDCRTLNHAEHKDLQPLVRWR